MNRKSKNFLLLLLFLLLFNYLCLAQNRNYQVDLFKDNISWNWQGKLNWHTRIKQKNRFFLNNAFTSNLFRESGLSNKWKDEDNLESGWEQKFSSRLLSATRLRSHIFSDENSFVKFSKHLLFQEFQVHPVNKLKVSPALGWAVEEMYGFRDQGWYTQLNADLKDWDLGGYVNNSEIFNSIYFFPGRRNQEHRYFMSFNKKFSEFANDSLRVGYEFMKNSYHLARVEFLENVEINSRFLYNRLGYHVSPKSRLDVETRIESRDISQSNPDLLNHRNEQNISNKVSLVFNGESFNQGVTFFTSQNTNLSSRSAGMRAESRNDLEGLQAAFNLFSHWKMNQSNELQLTFAYTKYQYSSPDTTQMIDEDDLRFISDLRFLHRFSTYFSASLAANFYFYHQIYIHANRSANNNWNRIFQLTPSFHLRIPRLLEHTNRIKILANYTVYDFDEILPQIRSYIFRELVFIDSLSIHLSAGLRLQTNYQLEKEDDGTFLKNLFAQQVSRELTSHFFDIRLVYVRITGLQLATGFNWYFRKEWVLFPRRRLARNYRAFSPRLTILYSLGPRLLLHLSIAPKTYRDLNIKRRYFGTGKVNLKYYF